MRVTVFNCDICGNESDPELMLHTADGKDVCVACLENLVKQHFKEKKFEEILESASAKKPVPLKKKPAAEVKFDWGKAQALRDAGWTVKRISTEMKCSEQAVYNNTKVPKVRPKKVHEWNDDDMARLGMTDKDEIEEAMADGNH